MSVTHVPAKPAVTKIVEVSPATPEKYVLELTLHQALCLAVLSGTTSRSDDDGGLWRALCNHPLYNVYREERDEAYDEGRAPSFKDLTGGAAQPDSEATLSSGHICVRRTVEDTGWTVGKVYTVDMNRGSTSGHYHGVVCDDDGNERVYFPEDFEPV